MPFNGLQLSVVAILQLEKEGVKKKTAVVRIAGGQLEAWKDLTGEVVVVEEGDAAESPGQLGEMVLNPLTRRQTTLHSRGTHKRPGTQAKSPLEAHNFLSLVNLDVVYRLSQARYSTRHIYTRIVLLINGISDF